MQNPSASDISKLVMKYKVMKYIKGSSTLGLVYTKEIDVKELNVHCEKSYVIYLGENAIS